MQIANVTIPRVGSKSLLAMFVLLAAAIGSLQFPALTYAMPPMEFAEAASGNCTLPDGQLGTFSTTNGDPTCCPKGSSDGVSCFYAKYLNPTIALLSAAVGVVVVIAIVVGAIEYVTSGGDPQRAASGKKRITSALLGLVAFLLLDAFLQFLIPGGLLNNG